MQRERKRCIKHLRGYCKHGEHCRYSHDIEPQQQGVSDQSERPISDLHNRSTDVDPSIMPKSLPSQEVQQSSTSQQPPIPTINFESGPLPTQQHLTKRQRKRYRDHKRSADAKLSAAQDSAVSTTTSDQDQQDLTHPQNTTSGPRSDASPRLLISNTMPRMTLSQLPIADGGRGSAHRLPEIDTTQSEGGEARSERAARVCRFDPCGRCQRGELCLYRYD